MTGVDVSRAEGAQVLRLARPEKKNALTGAMYSALCDAIEAGDADSAIAAHIIMGTSGVFTSGNDLADFLAVSRGIGDLGQQMLRFIRLLPVIRKPRDRGRGRQRDRHRHDAAFPLRSRLRHARARRSQRRFSIWGLFRKPRRAC